MDLCFGRGQFYMRDWPKVDDIDFKKLVIDFKPHVLTYLYYFCVHGRCHFKWDAGSTQSTASCGDMVVGGDEFCVLHISMADIEKIQSLRLTGSIGRHCGLMFYDAACAP